VKFVEETEVRILVADDDVVLTHLLDERLRERGHEVRIAHDALQAWQMARREPPDLILLDIKMPGGTGLAVLRRLKTNQAVRHVPVIVITAAEEQSILQQILALQPDALLRKPVKLTDIDFEISRLLVRRELANSALHISRKGSG
jgi:two-component system cell cycle response regulator